MATIKVILQGGIGNQLFILCAAQEYARLHNREISIELGLLNDSQKEFAILASNFTFSQSTSFKESRTTYIFFLKVLTKIVRILNKIGIRFESLYVNTKIGFQNEFLSSKKIRFINSYLQSADYVEDNSDVLKGINNYEVNSDIFARLEKELLKVDPIVVHIRRADYVLFKNIYGLLSTKYFQNGIDVLNQPLSSTVWVFTDEYFDQIRELSPGRVFVKNDFELNDFETLLLMSKAKKIVISNSTYSWWAARLNSNNKKVIAPSNWLINAEHPSGIYPKSWIVARAIWEDCE